MNFLYRLIERLDRWGRKLANVELRLEDKKSGELIIQIREPIDFEDIYEAETILGGDGR